jgi:hypothetical protein
MVSVPDLSVPSVTSSLPTDPPTDQFACRLRELVEYYKQRYGSYNALERHTEVRAGTIRSWTVLWQSNPESPTLPNLGLLLKFCYRLGWSFRDFSEFMEGDESVVAFAERIDARLQSPPQEALGGSKFQLQSESSSDPLESSPNSPTVWLECRMGVSPTSWPAADGSSLGSTEEMTKEDVQGAIAHHLFSLARLTGTSQLFRLRSVVSEFIRFVSPYASIRLKNLVIASGLKRDWTESHWENAQCDMDFYKIVMGILGDSVYDFKLDSLKTLTPYLYEVVSWDDCHYPVLNTAHTYKGREQELIHILENEKNYLAVSAI